MLQNGTYHNRMPTFAQENSELGTPLPDETTLKKVYCAIANGETGRNEADVSASVSINNFSVWTRNTFLIQFSGSECQRLTVLLKKVEESKSNELQAYSTFFKEFKGQPDLYNLIPRSVSIQKPFLFLENLPNFQHIFDDPDIDPLNLDFNHCLLAVETLARFHAKSYLLRRHLGEKGKGKLEMVKKYPFLNQHSNGSFYSSKLSSRLSPNFEKAFDLACKLVEVENPSLAFKLQRKVPDPSGIFDRIVKLLEEEKYDNDDFYTVCHGSFLPESLMFNYNNNHQEKEPWECRIVNLGSLYVGPLASDLALFLLTSTSLSFRQEFEEKLLAFYCDAFQEQVLASAKHFNKSGEVIAECEENIDEFHRKVEKQYRKMLEFSFYHVCYILPFIAFRRNKSLNDQNLSELHQLSLSEMMEEFSNLISGDKKDDFENFALNNAMLGGRLVEILKQLAKYRVLI